jgi:AcrR family transcriptional regulator
MAKGEDTRGVILDAALNVASTVGLEALTIGSLAGQVGLSKSGLFAHFKSKESLQIHVLEHARADFVENVLAKALAQPRGVPRVRALFERWLAWGQGGPGREGGCVFLQAAAEYDDRPGEVRDCLVASQRDWTGALCRAAQIAIDEGHFAADSDPAQFAFELYGLMMSCHFHARLLSDRDAQKRANNGFERLLAAYR